MFATQVKNGLLSLRWLPAYWWQRLTRRLRAAGPLHLILCLADHFVPSILPETPHLFATSAERERRVERWCCEYPNSVGKWRDADGRPLRHTYFFPGSNMKNRSLTASPSTVTLGGDLEVHLHHGVSAPDTAANTRRALEFFRDKLVDHGCLSRWDGIEAPRYAFIHGNWTLANSGNGVACGVDDEMQLLAETGCYADLTLPLAPNPAQTAKINALYECAGPLDRRAPHRRGRDLLRGHVPQIFPLIVQGPLGLDFGRSIRGLPISRIENGEVTTNHPPTMDRLKLWQQAAITVRGRLIGYSLKSIAMAWIRETRRRCWAGWRSVSYRNLLMPCGRGAAP